MCSGKKTLKLQLTFLVIVVLFFVPRSSKAGDLNPCEAYYANVAQENKVRAALDLFLQKSDDAVVNAELEKLDGILARQINSTINQLPPSQRQHFIDTLGKSEPAQYFTEGQFLGMPYLSQDALGAVSYSPLSNPIINVQFVTLKHPLSRVILSHEFSHLSRLDNAAQSALEVDIHASKVMERRLGVYREELQAWGDEWQYLSALYKEEDLAQLKAKYPPASKEAKKKAYCCGRAIPKGSTPSPRFGPNEKASRTFSSLPGLYRRPAQ